MEAQWVRSKIQAGLPDAEVDVRDLTGTGDHFEARVISPAFSGKTMIEQHRLVYATVDEVLKTGELHALALKTYSPEQWKKLGGLKTV